MNQFERKTPTGRTVQTCDAADRCEMVRTFTRQQCEQAMRINMLQASVYQAIQRRLREIERERLAARKRGRAA